MLVHGAGDKEVSSCVLTSSVGAGQSKTIKNTLSPQWDQEFIFEVTDESQSIEMTVPAAHTRTVRCSALTQRVALPAHGLGPHVQGTRRDVLRTASATPLLTRACGVARTT